MAAFGPTCGVDDNLAVLKANELANAYGMDAISAGMSIAFVIECCEHGLLGPDDAEELPIHWGDAAAVVRAVELIGRRQGLGDLLAEGVARMSAWLGPETEPFNVTVKGQELPMHEPRLKVAMGVGYAVAPVGADHMMNMHDTAFVHDGASIERVNQAPGQPVGPVPAHVLNEDKVQILYREVNWRHFQDCALICHFYCYDYRQLARVLSAVTGVDYTIADILAVGARAQTWRASLTSAKA